MLIQFAHLVLRLSEQPVKVAILPGTFPCVLQHSLELPGQFISFVSKLTRVLARTRGFLLRFVNLLLQLWNFLEAMLQFVDLQRKVVRRTAQLSKVGHVALQSAGQPLALLELQVEALVLCGHLIAVAVSLVFERT